MPDERTWWVRVNDAHILACGQGASWWFWYRRRCDLGGRIHVENATLGGDIVRVACDDREHAEWLAGYMHKMGVPKSCAKPVRA
jgi:hypothetical protein